MSTLDIPTARVFQPLLEPARYKGAEGGRGSGKSHFFAENLVEDSLCRKGLLSVCIREIQKSLKQSAKRLIEGKLEKFQLGGKDGFKVFKDVIQTPGDGIIIFQGMQDHTAESIKSLEGFHRAWVEEAQTLSATSLQMLRPTMRADDSELWFSWNPRRRTDAVDVMFNKQLPTGATHVKANWNDNPWFPKVLEDERQDCLLNDPDQYDHVWEGEHVSVAKGAYFAEHLARVKLEKRITEINPDPYMIYRAYVDIGGTGAKSDNFVIWITQFVGPRIHVLNHYEVQGQSVGAHLGWLRENGYTPGSTKIWLPHDGETHDRVFDVSYESAFKKAGYEVEVVPNQGKGAAMQRVQQARKLFPNIWFNRDSTEPGREALGWYHEKIDDVRNVGLGPDHDWSSHSADAFGLMAVAYEKPETDQYATAGGIAAT